MGWHPSTYVYMGSPEDVAEAYRRHLPDYRADIEDEVEKKEYNCLPANMDNSAAQIHPQQCLNFSRHPIGKCPFGVRCHYAHSLDTIQSNDAFELEMKRQKEALDKLIKVTEEHGPKYEDSTRLWEVAEKQFRDCPSYLHEETEGTSYIHVIDPAKHVATHEPILKRRKRGSDYTPSSWTLERERLKDFSEGAAESSEPSPVEWLQLAVAEAAATGQHMFVEHSVI